MSTGAREAPSGARSSGTQSNSKDAGTSGGEDSRGASRHQAFETDYMLSNILGKGGFAEVWQAYRRANGALVAVKIIDVPRGRDHTAGVLRVKEEVTVLFSLQNENIIQLSDVCRVGDTFYLVMELCRGGEVLDQVIKRPYNEGEARQLMRELLGSVAYLHDNGVVHGDLKLENLLLKNAGARTEGVKIADFGLARELGGANGRIPVERAFGSIHYCSPEVCGAEMGSDQPPGCDGSYGVEVDMWALGCALYIALTGSSPFHVSKKESIEVVFGKVVKGSWAKHDAIDALSEAGKDMLNRLLTVDPSQRITAKEALAHEWIAGPKAPTPPETAASSSPAGPKSSGGLSGCEIDVVGLGRALHLARLRGKRSSGSCDSCSPSGSRESIAPVASQAC